MKRTLPIFIIILFSFLLACEKTATKPADNYLSGKWVEHVPDGKMYFAATLHSFSFIKDSFKAKIVSWTDVVVIIPSEPCPSKAYEEIYIKGNYTLVNDSIYFSGKFCDSLYQNLHPTCSGITDYNEKFLFTKNDTAIILNADKPSDFGNGIILKKQ